MTQARDHAKNETDVRKVIDAWMDAVRRKDIDGILQNHSPDFVMFDVPPPFQSKGLEEYKKTWDLFLSWSSPPVTFDATEMTITAGADVAFAVAAMHCRGAEPGSNDEPASLNFRLTIGLRKTGGQWTITHEHHSVPAES